MIKITETRLREGIQFGLGSNGIWTPELENEIVEEIRKQALSQHAVIKNEVAVCEHKNEVMRQGDGFVYVTCKDCGEEL